MSAPAAAEAAGITYRQLGYWERQGWIGASHVVTVSPERRVRRYAAVDVVRLAALRHLARSGFDVAAYGPHVGQLDLTEGMVMVVGDDPHSIAVVEVEDLTAAVTVEGRWSVFDPAPIYRTLAGEGLAGTPPVSLTSERRSA